MLYQLAIAVLLIQGSPKQNRIRAMPDYGTGALKDAPPEAWADAAPAPQQQ